MPLPSKLIFDELKLRVAVKGGGRTMESMWSIMGDALRRCGKTWFGFNNVTDGIGRCTDIGPSIVLK